MRTETGAEVTDWPNSSMAMASRVYIPRWLGVQLMDKDPVPSKASPVKMVTLVSVPPLVWLTVKTMLLPMGKASLVGERERVMAGGPRTVKEISVEVAVASRSSVAVALTK